VKKILVNEILKNLWTGDPLVLKYLFNEKYYDYITLDNFRRQVHSPKIKEIKLTIFICIINILFYILFTEIFHIEGFLIFDLQKILNDFEVWRIFTSIFIHPERFFLVINTFFLYSVGSYFEVNNALSKSVYFFVYVLSGVIGNIAYMFFSSQIPDYVQSAGASGAIFGLAGAFIIILLKKRKYNWSIIYIIICIFFYIYTINPVINYISHLFGFITGIMSYLFCIIFYRNKTRSGKKNFSSLT
ncbi:MAG: rhomboid family intramembrane serine protease, partial [Candidatus Hermodarchaeota archaeon]